MEAVGRRDAIDSRAGALTTIWALLERQIAELAASPAGTVEGLIAKRKILDACLRLDGGVNNMLPLLSSLLEDLDRVMDRRNAQLPASPPAR